MKDTVRAMLSALLVVGVLVGLWVLVDSKTPLFEVGAVRPSALSGDTAYSGVPLTEEYANEQYRFSLSFPEGFSVGELPVDEAGGTAIIIQNEKGEGIQIYVVPSGGGQKILSAEDIRASIPDMAIDAPEPVAIGNEHQGVAFLSNNEAFGGASREVWFYFRGNLYQISAYARQDILLKAMFATWKFF